MERLPGTGLGAQRFHVPLNLTTVLQSSIITPPCYRRELSGSGLAPACLLLYLFPAPLPLAMLRASPTLAPKVLQPAVSSAWNYLPPDLDLLPTVASPSLSLLHPFPLPCGGC